MTIRWIDEEKCASIFFSFQYWLFKSNGHLNVNDKHKREICEVENLISITSTKKRFVIGGKKTFHHKHEDGKIDFEMDNGNEDDISSCILFHETITLKYNHLMPM